MKLLQILKNNKIIKSPKILEFGKDFNCIFKDFRGEFLVMTQNQNINHTDNKLTVEYDEDIICQLSDCYESRPLTTSEISAINKDPELFIKSPLWNSIISITLDN